MMEVSMTKTVEIYVTYDLEEFKCLRDMLTLLNKDILSKLPQGGTAEQQSIINTVNYYLEEAKR